MSISKPKEDTLIEEYFIQKDDRHKVCRCGTIFSKPKRFTLLSHLYNSRHHDNEAQNNKILNDKRKELSKNKILKIPDNLEKWFKLENKQILCKCGSSLSLENLKYPRNLHLHLEGSTHIDNLRIIKEKLSQIAKQLISETAAEIDCTSEKKKKMIHQKTMMKMVFKLKPLLEITKKLMKKMKLILRQKTVKYISM